MSTKPKYYESRTTFENGMVFYRGELYGWEDEFWQDCESGKILFIEDVSLALEQNLPDSEEMTRATE